MADADLADDALIAPSSPPAPNNRRVRGRRGWLWALLGLAAAVPIGLTLASALTSPPHVKSISQGHLVYLEADAPSEHTTTLRGLYLASPDGPPRPLTRENEPQDVDGGVREWITQPALSPDGRQVAYEKQLITLVEEKQALVNQIWTLPLDGSQPPRLVLDLTQQKLKQPVGLAWLSDTALLFLEDGRQYTVSTDTPALRHSLPLDLGGLTPQTTLAVSATRLPRVVNGGVSAYSVQTAAGPQILVQRSGRTTHGPVAGVFALAPSGHTLAYVPPGTSRVIRLYDLTRNAEGGDLPVRWGWSVFGRRKITSLRWSPDGTQIAYTVSKPPVPDDEIFVVDLTTRTIVQLPLRTGPAAWDWGQ